MFDLPVAAALFRNICSSPSASLPRKADEEIAAMAAKFASQQRQRASQVSAEQRQAMYVQLAAEMNALPDIFVRRRDCQIVPLVPGGSSSNHAAGVGQ
jgi:hypothetical protein